MFRKSNDLYEFDKLKSNVVVSRRRDASTNNIDGVMLPVDVSAVFGNFLSVSAVSANRQVKWMLPTYLRARWMADQKKSLDKVSTTIDWTAFGPTIYFEPDEGTLEKALLGSERPQQLIAATVQSGTAASVKAYAALSPQVDALEASELLEPTRLRLVELYKLCRFDVNVVETPFSMFPTHYYGPSEPITLFSDRTAMVLKNDVWDQLRDLCSAMVFGSVPSREMRDVTALMPGGSTSLLLRDFWARFLRLNRLALLLSTVRLQPQLLQYHLMKPVFPILLEQLRLENRGDAEKLVSTAIQGLERLPLLPPFSQILSHCQVTTAGTRYGDVPVLPWYGGEADFKEMIAKAALVANDTWDTKGMKLFDSAKLCYDWTTDLATSLSSSFNDYQSMIEAKLKVATEGDGTREGAARAAQLAATYDFPLNLLELGLLLHSRFTDATQLRQAADTATLGLLSRFTRGSGASRRIELRGVDYASFDGLAVNGNPADVLLGFQPTLPYGTGLMALSNRLYDVRHYGAPPRWYIAGAAAVLTRPESFVFGETVGRGDLPLEGYSPYIMHPSERIGEQELYTKGAYLIDYLSSRDISTTKSVAEQLRSRYLGKAKAGTKRVRFSSAARRLRLSAGARAEAQGKAKLDSDWLNREAVTYTAAKWSEVASNLRSDEAVEVDGANNNDGVTVVEESAPLGDDLFLRPMDGEVFLRRIMIRNATFGTFAYLRSGARRLELVERSVETQMLIDEPPAAPDQKLAPYTLAMTGPVLDSVVQVGDEMPPEFFINPQSVRVMGSQTFAPSEVAKGAELLGVVETSMRQASPETPPAPPAPPAPVEPAPAAPTESDVASVLSEGSEG